MGMLGSLASLAMHQRTVGRVMCCLAPAVRRSTLSFRPSFIGCFPIGFLRVFSLWSWGIVEERRLQLQWWESPTFPAQGHRDLLWISCLEFSGFAACLPRNLLNLFLPSLICDVDPHPIFFCFLVVLGAAILQLTVSWFRMKCYKIQQQGKLFAIPGAQLFQMHVPWYLHPSDSTRSSKTKTGVCILCFNAVFVWKLFPPPLFLRRRIKVINDTWYAHLFFWLDQWSSRGPEGAVFWYAEIEVGMEALMIRSILLEISPRMERQSFQEIWKELLRCNGRRREFADEHSLDLKLANVDTLNERPLWFEHTEGTLVCARILRVRWLIVVFVLSSKDFVASDTSDILTCQVIFKTVGGGNENPDSTNPNGMPTTAASCFANDVVVTSTGGICFEPPKGGLRRGHDEPHGLKLN